jgi:hypothetical protein
MKKALNVMLTLGSFFLISLQAVENDKTTGSKPVKQSKETSFSPFTGKITKSKVRLRLQPTYDGQVIQELNPGDIYVILDETDDFFSVKPPSDFKSYVFRTFVLDNVIEGNRVNVRLKPDLDAPVIAQLNSGDRVEGTVFADNPKWLEITMPGSARFYVAKEYVEKIGDVDYLARLEKRREDVYHLLSTNEMMSQSELQKPFNQTNIEGIKASYQRILSDYPDFPDAVTKARENLTALQENYTNKKLAYLESQSRHSSNQLETKTQVLNQELQAHKSKIATLEQQLEQGRQAISQQSSSASSLAQTKPNSLPINMSIWMPQEESLFMAWSQHTGNSNPASFYNEQKQNAVYLRGVIDPYNRPVKNKPGDYMLVQASNKLPLAFLYSTQINLQDYVGHEVTLKVAPRPNNHYAFPAYFVLSVE